MNHHIIFEGAELSGKSWLMSQLYKVLEPAGATNPNVLDGCYWFNCDLGFMGTSPAPQILNNYLAIFKTLSASNILVEKFHLSELVYDQLYNQTKARNFSSEDFKRIDQLMRDLNFKLIFLTFPEDKELIARRLEDRLRLYPSYGRIAKTPEFYLRQQALYQEKIKASNLDYLSLEITHFPAEESVAKIRKWLEK